MLPSTKKIFQKQKIVEVMKEIHHYVGMETDWLIIKRQLINNLPVDLREKLSKRHPHTKKHTVTPYDKQMMDLWRDITGIELVMNPAKLHKDNTP